MKFFLSKRDKRIRLCRENLTRRLDIEVKGDYVYQISWLVHHLEEYLERWLGFARLENLSLAATLDNDVFYIVLAASNILDEKIACLNSGIPFPTEEWKHYLNALEWIQKTPDRSELGLIADTFESFIKRQASIAK